MENSKKPQVDSASSITSQLFGSPSVDIFASIFPPKEIGRNLGSSEVRGSWQKEPLGSGNQPWNTKQDDKYKVYKQVDGSHGSKEKSSIYQQEGAEPWNLSSSLYYGGQDIYLKTPSHPTSSSYPLYKKDGGEDDPSGDSRSNWWEGSLYY